MAKIILKSCNLKSWYQRLLEFKVELIKLQTRLLRKSLRESKDNVDLLLEGQEVSLLVTNLDIAQEFQREAKELGVECVIEN